MSVYKRVCIHRCPGCGALKCNAVPVGPWVRVLHWVASRGRKVFVVYDNGDSGWMISTRKGFIVSSPSTSTMWVRVGSISALLMSAFYFVLFAHCVSDGLKVQRRLLNDGVCPKDFSAFDFYCTLIS